MVVSYSPVQHDYPRSPLATSCKVTSWFDAIRGVTRKPHRALDIVRGDGPKSAYGDPVYAMESGTVTATATGKPPAGVPVKQCTGLRYPGNFVQVRSDGGRYKTLYFHITPAVGIVSGVPVSQGQLWGTIDDSGCQDERHVHVARKGPDGISVNLSIPCVNGRYPTQKLWEDTTVDDDVDDTLIP